MPRLRLVVEGKDDVHVVWHVLRRMGMRVHRELGIGQAGKPPPVPDEIFVASPAGRPGEESGGWRSLVDLARIGERWLTDSDTVGFVVDSDAADHEARPWPALREALRKASKVIPDDVPAGGLVLPATATLPRLGVWVMPSPDREGNLEDFFIASLPAGDPMLPLATRAVDQDLRTILKGEAAFLSLRSKRVAHTRLAWSETPGQPLGAAVRAGMFSDDAPTVVAFGAWARWLFEQG